MGLDESDGAFLRRDEIGRRRRCARFGEDVRSGDDVGGKRIHRSGGGLLGERGLCVVEAEFLKGPAVEPVVGGDGYD